MSARDALFRDIWDMRSTEEKNALIDAYAHELAEKQRRVANEWAADGYTAEADGLRQGAGLIDPEAKGP